MPRASPATADDATELANLVAAFGISAAFAMPSWVPLTAQCDPTRAAHWSGARADHCRTIARTLATTSDTVIGARIGLAIRQQLALELPVRLVFEAPVLSEMASSTAASTMPSRAGALSRISPSPLSDCAALAAGEWSGCLADWSLAVEDAIGRIAAGDARVNLALTTNQSRPLNVLSRVEALKRDD